MVTQPDAAGPADARGTRPSLRALALTSAAFAAGPGRVRSSRAAARLLTRALDSGAAIRWLTSGPRTAPTSVFHPRRREQVWLRDLARQDPSGLAGAFGTKVCQTREPVMLSVVWSSLLKLWTSPLYWPYLDTHEVSGLLVVPLVAYRGVVGGILMAWRERPHGAFSEEDLLFLKEVARRLALS